MKEDKGNVLVTDFFDLAVETIVSRTASLLLFCFVFTCAI